MSWSTSIDASTSLVNKGSDNKDCHECYNEPVTQYERFQWIIDNLFGGVPAAYAKAAGLGRATLDAAMKRISRLSTGANYFAFTTGAWTPPMSGYATSKTTTVRAWLSTID